MTPEAQMLLDAIWEGLIYLMITATIASVIGIVIGKLMSGNDVVAGAEAILSNRFS